MLIQRPRKAPKRVGGGRSEAFCPCFPMVFHGVRSILRLMLRRKSSFSSALTTHRLQESFWDATLVAGAMNWVGRSDFKLFPWPFGKDLKSFQPFQPI